MPAGKGLHNIQGFVSTGEETIVCEGCADVVFFEIDLHDFSDQRKVLANASRMMKTDGSLVDLDWKKETTRFGPPQDVRFSEQEAAELIGKVGFSVIEVRDIPRGFIVSPLFRCERNRFKKGLGRTFSGISAGQELKGCRVHTETLMRRGRAIVEYVTQMGIATGTEHFCSNHSVTPVDP